MQLPCIDFELVKLSAAEAVLGPLKSIHQPSSKITSVPAIQVDKTYGYFQKQIYIY